MKQHLLPIALAIFFCDRSTEATSAGPISVMHSVDLFQRMAKSHPAFVCIFKNYTGEAIVNWE